MKYIAAYLLFLLMRSYNIHSLLFQMLFGVYMPQESKYTRSTYLIDPVTQKKMFSYEASRHLDMSDYNHRDYTPPTVMKITKYPSVVNRFFEYGSDGRVHTKQNNTDEVLIDIAIFIDQMEILKTLENPELGLQDKLRIVEEYESKTNPKVYTANISKGGLFKDWNYTL